MAKSRNIEYVESWLNSKRSDIPFPNLINELLGYGNRPEFIQRKANRIYIKCLRAKKLQLAEKIATKYRLNEIKDDAVMAMNLSMRAIQKLKEDGKE